MSPNRVLASTASQTGAIECSRAARLGEVAKFCPFSEDRFDSLTAGASGSWELSFRGKAGEQVEVTSAHAESGQLHRLKGVVGPDGTGKLSIAPNEMWRQ